MPREYKLYLSDILAAIERIESYVQSLDLDEFIANNMVVDAVLHNFSVIGEAAKNVPGDICAKYPDVPWRAVGAFRNLLAHEYFRVDLEETWRIIQGRLPELKQQIAAILAEEDGETQ